MGDDHPPKSLLRFGDLSLLERHLTLLQHMGIEDIVIAVGYKADLIQQAISDFNTSLNITTIHNPDYEQGSVVSLWAVRSYLQQDDDILLMDADVLYDQRLLARLMTTEYANCLLLDRDFESGDEAVKLCVRDGKLVEFRKHVSTELRYDFAGESVGFFRFSGSTAMRLGDQVADYIKRGASKDHYEEAIRDLMLADKQAFGYEDISGLPWIEIDFPEDVERARNTILPSLEGLPKSGKLL